MQDVSEPRWERDNVAESAILWSSRARDRSQNGSYTQRRMIADALIDVSLFATFLTPNYSLPTMSSTNDLASRLGGFEIGDNQQQKESSQAGSTVKDGWEVPATALSNGAGAVGAASTSASQQNLAQSSTAATGMSGDSDKVDQSRGQSTQDPAGQQAEAPANNEDGEQRLSLDDTQAVS